MAPRKLETDKMLESAFAAVNRLGVRNLTMVDIATEAGISRHTLYRRFKSKDELLVELGDYLVRRFYDELLEAVESTPDPAKRVGVIASTIVRGTRDENLGRLIELEPAFYRASIKQYFPDWVRVLTQMLTWPDPPPNGSNGNRLVRCAEALMRHGISLELLEPEDWPREIETMTRVGEGLLKG
jgi:AcrR family transcriptional regulator